MSCRVDGSISVKHDPLMLHGEAKEGECILTLSDDTQVRCRVTEKGTERMVRPPKGVKWERTPAAIDSLVNSISYDPVRFKEMEPAARVKALLGMLPSAVTAAEISEAIGTEFKTIPGEEVGLHTIGRAYEQLYAARRDESVAADTQFKHAKELGAAVPAGEEAPADPMPIRSKRQVLIDGIRAHNATVVKMRDETIAEHKAAHLLRCQQMRDEHSAKVRALEAEMAAKTQASNATLADEVQKTQAEAAAAVKPEAPQELHDLTAELATAEANYKAWAASAGTVDAMNRARQSAEEHKATADALTQSLENLKRLQENVAKKLNIPGFSIQAPKPGLPVDVCKEEAGGLVPFSQWNTAAQLFFCIKVARMSKGQCGIILIETDGIDKENRIRMMEAVGKLSESEGIQFVMVTATCGDLKISDRVE